MWMIFIWCWVNHNWNLILKKIKLYWIEKSLKSIYIEYIEIISILYKFLMNLILSFNLWIIKYKRNDFIVLIILILSLNFYNSWIEFETTFYKKKVTYIFFAYVYIYLANNFYNF